MEKKRKLSTEDFIFQSDSSLDSPCKKIAKSDAKPFLKKVISGGQSGADRGGLEAAQSLGIPTGGIAPKGWKTEFGPDRDLEKFGLKEGPHGYPSRTKMNVDLAQATIVFRLHSGSGTDKTIGYAQTQTWCSRSTSSNVGYRPVLVINSLDTKNVKHIVEFLKTNNVEVVNIAGHRESTAGIEKFSSKVRNLLIPAFIEYNNIEF